MRFKHFVAVLLGLAAVLSFTGCASAVSTAIKKSDLDVQTKMSDTIFLEPVASEKRVVYVRIRNTSDKDINIENEVMNTIAARGYRVTQNPDEAHYMLQANVLQVGKSDLREVDNALVSGFGGAAAGLGIMAAARSTSTSQYATAGLIGAAAGIIGDALVEDTLYSMVTDLEVRERALNGEKIEQVLDTSASQGSASTIKQKVTGGSTDWKIYRTRIASTANQVNLEFEDAKPELIKGLARSISGIF